jgi:hypothetical protein
MQRYESDAAASSSPSTAKPIHIADYAAFDEESLLRYFMDTDKTGKSLEQLE